MIERINQAIDQAIANSDPESLEYLLRIKFKLTQWTSPKAENRALCIAMKDDDTLIIKEVA